MPAHPFISLHHHHGRQRKARNQHHKKPTTPSLRIKRNLSTETIHRFRDRYRYGACRYIAIAVETRLGSSSRSSSTSSFRSALPSPSPSASEWPFPALSRSGSSSLSSSAWPFVVELSPSTSQYSSSSIPWSSDFEYQTVPAKDCVGIYPTVLPPPDFFDLDKEAEKIKDKFKKGNWLDNYLYDETGKVNLPIHEKGKLILDQVSRTRMIDAEVELMVLDECREWINEAIDEAKLGTKQGVDWLKGMERAVSEEIGTVFAECKIVIEEERRKRGLTDWEAHLNWRSYGHPNLDVLQDDQTSNSNLLGSAEGPTKSNDGHDCFVKGAEELGNDSPSPKAEMSPPDPPGLPETSRRSDDDTPPPANGPLMFW